MVWLWVVGAAHAEQMRVESLAWKVWSSDVVVRATVEPTRAPAPPRSGDLAEPVTVRVDEVLHGALAEPSLTLRWQPADRAALAGAEGGPVLLFLVDDGRGGLAPRGARTGWIDLREPAPALATTADCAVLHDAEALLAHVRALPARPAALGSTQDWALPAPTWRACGAHTEGHQASDAGSGVDVLVPPGDLDLEATPTLHLGALSEPMHWFGVSAIVVEWTGCSVGVPVDGDGEPLLRCATPGSGGVGTPTPAGLRGAERAARRAFRAHFREDERLGERPRRMSVVYQGAERRAWLCEHRLVGGGWDMGWLEVGLRDGEGRRAPTPMRSAGRAGLLGCTGRPLDGLAPLAGDASFYLDLTGEAPGPAAVDALLARLPALLGDRPPFQSAGWSREGPWSTAPTRLAFGADGRPRPEGPAFRVPLPEDLARPVFTRVRYLVWEQGRPQVVADVTVEGVPEDWSAAAGPTMPKGVPVTGILEVYSLDAAPTGDTPSREPGFERLALWSMFGAVRE